MISGKEALIALANGEEVEFYSEILGRWVGLNEEPFLSDVFEDRNMRLKPQTITINGIEVPKPFEPKEGEVYWYLTDDESSGYSSYSNCSDVLKLGAWRTEEEIKQVVEALRSVFK